MSSGNFSPQGLVRESVFSATRCMDVGRLQPIGRNFAVERLVKKHFGKPARCQPGEVAVICKASKRKTPIAFNAIPADLCGIKPLTGHRFDRITKYGADVTDFSSHVPS